MAAYDPVKLKSLRPLHDHILVVGMEFNERFTNSGIYIPSDDKTTQGVRPRWARVYATGPAQHKVKVGQWLCIAHGRWTRGVDIEDESGNKLTVRRIDNEEILLVSDEKPDDLTMGVAINY